MNPGRVARIHVRGILDSRGTPTVEAELELASGAAGRASAPRAIAPGRLERKRTDIFSLGPLDEMRAIAALRAQLENREIESQAQLDTMLEALPQAVELGADMRMVISLAFCRASAAASNTSLVAHLAALAGTRPRMPRPVVNIFSGGIHERKAKLPFQQIMFAPDHGSIARNVDAALDVYARIERALEAERGWLRYSASMGMIVSDLSALEALDRLSEVVASDRQTIAIDVAAEHLRLEDGRYRFGGRELRGEELLESHAAMLDRYPVEMLEDPFDPADQLLWRQLQRSRPPSALVFGDDLFATDCTRLDPELANGMLLKINQVGTLSSALACAAAATKANMKICVSHRSGETEDAFICDLAVAIGATFIKVGGPRRGDRTVKYNQLLRLSEAWESDSANTEF